MSGGHFLCLQGLTARQLYNESNMVRENHIGNNCEAMDKELEFV